MTFPYPSGLRNVIYSPKIIKWISYIYLINAFPDYKNVFTSTSVKDNLVIMTGYSTCSDKRLDGPTIWTAKIVNDKVAEWRVYEDTLENRKNLEG